MGCTIGWEVVECAPASGSGLFFFCGFAPPANSGFYCETQHTQVKVPPSGGRLPYVVRRGNTQRCVCGGGGGGGYFFSVSSFSWSSLFGIFRTRIASSGSGTFLSWCPMCHSTGHGFL